jgi:hypothetical protein
MLQFAQPFGLFALATVAVPILMHLRRRPFVIVRVGSLRPLRGNQLPRRWLHLHDPLRLALRCAILTALALSLAGLEWNPRNPSPVRWCLLVPGTELAGTNRVEWDAHGRDGFELRSLSTGFHRIDHADSARASPPDPSLDVWSLLRQADLELPAGSRVIVFGPTWSSQFRGIRPTLRNVEVHWRPVQILPFESPPGSVARVGIVAGPDRSIDARYLEAAVRAIGATMITNQEPTWVFQLGSAELPPKWAEAVKRGARFVQDAPEIEHPQRVSREIETGSTSSSLHQRVNPGPGLPLFRDSQGEPWLTEERNAGETGTKVTWHFAFRFHPDWTDWPLSGAFPAWWREQLQPEPVDTTLIAPEQAAPRFDSHRDQARSSAVVRVATVDLRTACWLAAMMLFLAERALPLVQRRVSSPA